MLGKTLVLFPPAWTPAKLFAPADLGTWLDPTELAGAAQDVAGTPVTAFGQLLGQLLDKRFAYARGARLDVNGGFDTDTGWTKGTGWTISGGMARCDGSNGAATTLTSIAGLALSTNKLLEVGYDYGSTNGRLRFNPVAGSATALMASASSGSFRGTVFATVDQSLVLQAPDAATVCTVDNLYVREILGSHALQSTAGSRPTLSAGGVINFSSGTKSLVTTFPSALGSACTVWRAIPGTGAQILTAQTVGTTYTETTDNRGYGVINRALTASEAAQLARYLSHKAGG